MPKQTPRQVEQTKKAAENPEEAVKIMRGASAKVKAEAESVATSFERFKAALKEEVAGGEGGAAAAAASRKAPPKKRGPTNTGAGGGGVNSGMAARVQRRRR